jgi:hypothetical protein
MPVDGLGAGMQVRDVLPRDAIRSIDDPAFGADHFGTADDEVVVVDRGGRARAYPVRILDAHEIVNDRVGDDLLAVTWCPICGSAVVYDATVDDRRLEFGVSGKLADDGLVMYDRGTDGEWHQPTGRCLAGPNEGASLAVVPSVLTTYGAFRERYPDGAVLQPDREGDDAGGPAAAYPADAYAAYRDRAAFGLHGMRDEGEPRDWARDDLDPKAVVLGVVRGGEAVGYPRSRVAAAGGVVTDTVGGEAVVVAAVDGSLHAFESPGFDLSLAEGVLCGDGTTWDPVTGASADGRRLVRVPATRLYAFAWQDAHGPASFWAP